VLSLLSLRRAPWRAAVAGSILLVILIAGRPLAGRSQGELPIRCSLVNLLASPDDYDGERVQVVGYARLRFEGNALFLSQLDAEHDVFSNSVWLDISGWRRGPSSPATEGNQYAIVEGTFKKEEKGHMGLWPGAITQIERFDPWPPSWPPGGKE
jgi:hypothetical protein